MSRLRSWAILLLANVLRASCSGTGSLTFAIDTTLSMGDEIRQVKQSVNEIMDIVFKAKASRVEDMVLVTFNDPGTHLKINTTNRDDFRRVLDTVDVNNEDPNNDWPEMSMSGTLLGLENSHSDSFIYVFTDAPPKDNWKKEEVKEMCQRKQSQIVFVISAEYYLFSYYPEYETYYQIAAACSGMVYVCEDKKIPEAIEIIKNKIQNNDTVITSQEVKPNVRTFVKTEQSGGVCAAREGLLLSALVAEHSTGDTPSGIFNVYGGDESDISRDINAVGPLLVSPYAVFTVDDYIDTVQIEATGENIIIKVNTPIETQDRRLWRSHSKVLRLKSPPPGTYTAIVKSKSRAIVSISGTTNIFFKHGFSELEPKYMANTAPQPFADTKSYLSVMVTDLEQALNIKSAIILTTDEQRVIETLPLREISKDFYTTIPFKAPSHQFKVGLIGTTKNTGATIKRIAKIPVTPAKPIKLPDKMKPRVETMEGKDTKVEYKSSVKLTCTVYAYPKPEIKWLNNNAQVVPSKSSLVQDPYKYVSYMQIDSAMEHKTYTCYAVNTEGTTLTSIKVHVKDPFEVKTAPEGSTFVKYGSEGVLNCEATSSWPITISWYYADESKGTDRKLKTSQSYWISNDGTQLKIKKMDTNLAGRYTCKVSLNQNQDFTKSFSTRVKADGIEPPKLAADDKVKAIIGSKVNLYCRVRKGVPAPELTWVFNGKTIGHGTVLNLPKVEVNHKGNYICIGKNSLGEDERITKLIVQVPPKIANDGASNEVHAVEGDDTLNIPCSATGTPTPIITWELAGRHISNSDKYTIQNGVLTIKRPQVSDSSNYECVATNEVTSVRTKFRVQVDQKPLLTGLKSIKAIIGTEAKLICRVLKGVPLPKIVWQLNRKTVGYGDIFNIPAVEEKHKGNYKCVAENAVGKAEHDVELIVLVPPKIFNGGSATEVHATDDDETLSVPCSASGAPPPVITWELAGRRISNDDRHTIQHGVLTIKRPQVSDSGDYECVATNEVTSVRTKFQVHVDQKIKLDGEKNIIARVGTSVNIKCNVLRGWPKPNISWFFIDRPLSETKDVLHIGAVKKDNAGNYRCVAENILGKVEHSTELIVQYPPRILTNSTVYNVNVDDVALRIPCVVVGVPKPNIKWTWTDTTEGAVWDRFTDVSISKKYVTEDGTLVIRNLSELDSDDYKCHATNAIGSVDKTFIVSVTIAPEDYNNPHHIYIEEGKSKNISCSSEHFDPATKFTRWFMEKMLFSNDTYLLIENATDADTGNYTCRVSDINEARTESYVVQVGKPPKFNAYQEGSLVNWFGDEPLLLDCKPLSNQLDEQVVWKYNGKVLPEANSMTLDAALKWGQYSCNLSNSLGSVQRTFDVTSQVCVMKKTYNETENMPLIFGSKNTWPRLESWMDYARMNPGEQLRLFCENDKQTSNGFLKFPSKSSIIATCVKQDIFNVDDKEYKISDLGCFKRVTPYIKNKNVKCLTETSELIAVGFSTQYGFVESYEVCFDHANNIPLYSHALVNKFSRNSSQNWNKLPEFGVNQLGDTCVKTSCCYGKTTLTSNEYFEYSTRQTAAFIDPFNSIPYLKDCGSRKSTWLTIDQTLKKKLFVRDFPASIWSGVHTLQKINGNLIPRYLWKVLRTKKKDPVAIVHINVADPTPEDIKCKMTKPSPVCSKLIDEYTYCCDYADFMLAFGLQHTDVGQLPAAVTA